MKITKDQQSKVWVLSSDTRVLYRGRRSPWDDPAILRAAFARERSTTTHKESSQHTG